MLSSSTLEEWQSCHDFYYYYYYSHSIDAWVSLSSFLFTLSLSHGTLPTTTTSTTSLLPVAPHRNARVSALPADDRSIVGPTICAGDNQPIHP